MTSPILWGFVWSRPRCSPSHELRQVPARPFSLRHASCARVGRRRPPAYPTRKKENNSDLHPSTPPHPLLTPMWHPAFRPANLGLIAWPHGHEVSVRMRTTRIVVSGFAVINSFSDPPRAPPPFSCRCGPGYPRARAPSHLRTDPGSPTPQEGTHSHTHTLSLSLPPHTHTPDEHKQPAARDHDASLLPAHPPPPALPRLPHRMAPLPSPTRVHR